MENSVVLIGLDGATFSMTARNRPLRSTELWRARRALLSPGPYPRPSDGILSNWHWRRRNPRGSEIERNEDEQRQELLDAFLFPGWRDSNDWR